MNGDVRHIFQETVWEYYRTSGRHDLPWRESKGEGAFDPYAVVVSELMLQQTQVERVIPKYRQFMNQFPNIDSLARAPLGAVLKTWSGLGYNRRAKFLHQTAQQIMRAHSGLVPRTSAELMALPGIGKNTAGAILAYAYNLPEVFIETNIKTVYLHHFFTDRNDVADKEIEILVAATIDTEHPREWYWALMDYGAYLKRTVGNLNHAIKSYKKQSKFEGSKRQIRGQILRALTEQQLTRVQLQKKIPDVRTEEIINSLLKEGLITQKGGYLQL